MIPELIWIAALIDRFEIARAAELCLTIARAARGVLKAPNHIWFGASSSFRLLGDDKQKAVVGHLRENGDLSSLQDGMRSIASYYPAFPLRFLFEGETIQPLGSNHLQSFKSLIAALFDRTARLATFTQAHSVYVAFDLGMLRVAPHLTLASFPQIEEYPKTELSKQIASSVRATVSSLAGMHHRAHPSSWYVEFWNRGFELEACDLD